MKKLGVVVGRFQTEILTATHVDLIDTSLRENDHTLIVVGVGPLPTTARNPLSFNMRAAMIADHLTDTGHSTDTQVNIIEQLADHPDDRIWSNSLDTLIYGAAMQLTNEEVEVTLYHGRDSFREVYSGNYPNFHEIDEHPLDSATRRRENIGRYDWPYVPKRFREGVIWANQNRFPTVYSCVDAAVVWNEYSDKMRLTNKYLLLITKDIAEGYMFPGGFAELNSTDEDDARREVMEETGIDMSFVHAEWLGSFTQDDWRYRSEVDEIRTRLFLFEPYGPLSERPKAVGADDAATAQWVNIKDLKVEDFNKCHRALFERLLEEL